MKVKVRKLVEICPIAVKASLGVRYWEDGKVNGVEDVNGFLIPCKDREQWKLVIDIETGQIKDWTNGTEADVHYKVCDDGGYTLVYNEDGKERLCHKEGYVPDFLAIDDNGYGDYVIMKIDKNGFIQNWEFTEEDVQFFFPNEEE